MKTLILCVDRDDDFGEKAGVKSPVVGREENLKAANTLILKDPEDSDANALFSGISTYDNLLRSGEDVEIATICGHKSASELADDILVKQLETVIKSTKATDVVFISDGAEDEFIIPLIQSRIKIRNIKRVIVRQEKNIESIYYIILKALKEEKFMKKVLIPVGVAFLVLGITILFVLALRVYFDGITSLDPATTGFMTVVTAIGTYLLGKAYSVGGRLASAFGKISDEFLDMRITLFSFLIAATILGYGIYLGYSVAVVNSAPILRIIQFIYRVVPFSITSIVVFDMGRIVEALTKYEKGEERRKFLRSYMRSVAYSASFFAAVLGLLSFVVYAYPTVTSKMLYLDLAVVLTVVGTLSGIVISLISRRIRHEDEPDGKSVAAQEDSDNF